MAFYAQIDPTATQPTKVIGFYDNVLISYKHDFTQPGFVTLTAAQWEARKGTDYWDNGQLVPPPAKTAEHLAAIAKASAQTQANTLLAETNNSVVLRCYEEGVPVPADWKTYRAQLREVVAGTLAILPTQPPLPTFS
jgi:hypothetical protein